MKSISGLSNQRWLLCVLTVIGVFAGACNEKPKVEMTAVPGVRSDISKPKFTAAMVDNKKDPNCGMPVTAGIADTVHYKGKVYGFCSDECKQAFLKNPVELTKNAELK